MTESKKLVLQTIDEKRTTLIPVDYTPALQTDIALHKHLGLPMNSEGEEQLLNYLGADLYYLSARDISQREGYHRCWRKKPELTETERICALGIQWRREVFNAKFSVDESLSSPLEGAARPSDFLQYNWPKSRDFDFTILIEEAERHSERAIVGGLWTGILGDAYRLVGYQNFLTNIALQPDLIHTLVNKLTDVYLELNDIYFQTLKGKMDIWFFGNDFGSQNGMLLSHEMWREYFFTPISQLCSLAHSYGLKVMMHSCGSIKPIIPDLIEAGVDILDPIQITAIDMEPEDLSEKYGSRIVFHGGIDTQKVLPFGSEDDVIRHCSQIITTFSSTAGYMAAGSQILGGDIPLENIIAMYGQIRALNSAIRLKSDRS